MGELNSFLGRQCCSQAHSLRRPLSLRGGMRPLHGARVSWGGKCQPDTAYSINDTCLGSCSLTLPSSTKTLLPPTLQSSCSASSRFWGMLRSLYGARCWLYCYSLFIVDTCYLTLLKKPFASGASIVKYRSVNVLLLSYNLLFSTWSYLHPFRTLPT